MWCAFVPASSRRCAVSLALLATARKNSSVSSVSKPPIVVRGIAPVERAVRPAAEVDRARRERLVHRHGRVAVAGDAAAVAERLVERLAEHDADVLGRVVRAGLEVARRLDVEVERAWRASRSSMWSRKPTPVDAALAGAVQRRAAAGRWSRRWCARSRQRVVVWWLPCLLGPPRRRPAARRAGPGLRGFRVHGEALRARDARRRAARARAPPLAATIPTPAGAGTWRAPSGPEKRAAPPGGQHVVGPRGVVAERRARRR